MRKLWIALLLVMLAFPFQTARSSAEYPGGTGALLASSSAPDLLTNWTWSFWVNSTTPGADYIIERYTNAATEQFYVGVFSSLGNKIQSGIPMVVWGIVTGGTPLTPGVWYHVVVTRSGNDWTIWMDGVIDGGPSANATAQESGGVLRLMNSHTGLTILVGKLAEVAGWDAVLTAGEISALAHGTPPNRIRATKIQYYWPLHTAGCVGPCATNPHVWPDLGGGGWNATATGLTDLISNHAPMSPPGGAN